MVAANKWGSVKGTLQYNGSTVGNGRTNHVFTIGGTGIKMLKYIGASYGSTDGLNANPILFGRVIVAKGSLAQPEVFIDPAVTGYPINGLQEILFDHSVFGGGEHAFDFSSQPIIAGDNETLTIIQTCAYRTGDTTAQCGQTIAGLNVIGETKEKTQSVSEAEGYFLR